MGFSSAFVKLPSGQRRILQNMIPLISVGVLLTKSVELDSLSDLVLPPDSFEDDIASHVLEKELASAKMVTGDQICNLFCTRLVRVYLRHTVSKIRTDDGSGHMPPTPEPRIN